ncbi:MAG: 5-(carboxyamino)imidazole ribonucleotide synthase [Planctomycetes bacterium]|nr:5-(carboxyamino)imidazole ribonucleotide synthase [Planctomycetota bacterium]MCH9726108.1 5-(carboxyamino)imidazole ribonucleotide synthase [Planctomycetota bacterium]MCH9777260.1 5-(carboxyamino)imidazole ribonucleotide synthase [Planctomycetota bacterium]MCH9791317.1 5-(carboxyamino)imidazole ribonucleotide synthase [Planctomycetota bacterium]
MSDLIPPGSTLGMLGSGQLGRMFAIEARRLGYGVHVFSPESKTPTGQVADVEICAEYTDLEAVAEFAKNVDVISFEFENVLSETTETASKYAPVRPGANVLHIAQNRIREKSELRDAGIPVTPFAVVRSVEELESALNELGCPAVLKSASSGYDGKGQVKIDSLEVAETAWNEVGSDETVLEAFIDYTCELSVVGVRGLDGEFAFYGPMKNDHVNHILDISVFPADVGDEISAEAIEITRAVFEHLDVVGVMCVEFFLTSDNRLMINEIAPRPHNSGHLTIDGHVTCQFEQQVRAICGLPLGSTQSLGPVAMANLLGDHWEAGPPNWNALKQFNDVKLHLYGKQESRIGRKMGHLTALAETPAGAIERVNQARAAIFND